MAAFDSKGASCTAKDTHQNRAIAAQYGPEAYSRQWKIGHGESGPDDANFSLAQNIVQI